jgi:hypothetical protein
LLANRLTRPGSEHALAQWLEDYFVCNAEGSRWMPVWKQSRGVKVDFEQLRLWCRTVLKCSSTVGARLGLAPTGILRLGMSPASAASGACARRLHAAAFCEPPVAHEEWQPNGELAQENIVLAIWHVEHSGEIAGGGDLLPLAADLHHALVGVVKVEVWLSEADGRADLDQGVGPGLCFAVVEDGEVAFADPV